MLRNGFLRLKPMCGVAILVLAIALANAALPAQEDRTIRATGRGVYPDWMGPAQARLMAERAARVDAYRKLAEQIQGVNALTGKEKTPRTRSRTTVVRGFVRGARVVAVRRFPDDGFVEVDMEVSSGKDSVRSKTVP